MGVFSEEVKATFEGHHIACNLTTDFGNQGLSGLKLYIDGQVVDTASSVFFMSNRRALLRGSLKHGESNHVVEIYSSGIINKRLNIFVDGKHIARSKG